MGTEGLLSMISLSDISGLKVAELRIELQARGLGAKGNKQALTERLRNAIQQEAGRGTDGQGEEQEDTPMQTARKQDKRKEWAHESTLVSHSGQGSPALPEVVEPGLASRAADSAAQLASRAAVSAGPLASHGPSLTDSQQTNSQETEYLININDEIASDTTSQIGELYTSREELPELGEFPYIEQEENYDNIEFVIKPNEAFITAYAALDALEREFPDHILRISAKQTSNGWFRVKPLDLHTA